MKILILVLGYMLLSACVPTMPVAKCKAQMFDLLQMCADDMSNQAKMCKAKVKKCEKSKNKSLDMF